MSLPVLANVPVKGAACPMTMSPAAWAKKVAHQSSAPKQTLFIIPIPVVMVALLRQQNLASKTVQAVDFSAS
jgi:hypothetical protein